MRVYRDIYPNLKETGAAAPERVGYWTLCVVLTVCLVTSVGLGFLVVNYHWLGDRLFPERCPDRLITLRPGPHRSEDDLWAYATFWSYSPRDPDLPVADSSQPIAKFAPQRLLVNLEQTFKPLSLKAFEHLPNSCREKLPSLMVQHPKFPTKTELYENGMKKMVMGFPDDLDPLSSLLFSADLSSEFQFRDRVSDLARYVMNSAEEVMNKRKKSFDAKIPIYLSPITPEMQQFLAPNGSIDLVAAQRKAIEAAMSDYRNTTKPVFIVMGEHALVPGIADDDVVRVSRLPDSVALAVISSGDGVILNHGLWPTFGALLARSNVTFHAINRTIIDAANNASLNWKASVTF